MIYGERLKVERWRCWWYIPWDVTIVTASVSALPGANNKRLKAEKKERNNWINECRYKSFQLFVSLLFPSFLFFTFVSFLWNCKWMKSFLFCCFFYLFLTLFHVFTHRSKEEEIQEGEREEWRIELSKARTERVGERITRGKNKGVKKMTWKEENGREEG